MSMLYSEREKRIYGPYDDGKGGAAIWGDPHRINRTLIRLLDGDPNRWFKAYRSENVDEQFEATNRLVAAATEAFGLQPFDKSGKGLLEDEILKILSDFSKWMAELKKKVAPTPTGSNASVGLPEVKVANPGNPGMPQTIKPETASLTRVGLPSG